MSEQTVKCPICSKPYVTYMHYAGDQSSCPACREDARKISTPGDNWPLNMEDW